MGVSSGNPTYFYKKFVLTEGFTLYFVYDSEGKVIYPEKAAQEDKKNKPANTEETSVFNPYMVRVKIDKLNIRTGPGTNYNRTGKFTGIGVFTIVEEKPGEGSEKGWGLLKAYEKQRDGWISLDLVEQI